MTSEIPGTVPNSPDEYRELKSDKRAQQAAFIKSQEERLKLEYDTAKHITTLNTGSILILVTFLEKLFANPFWKALVAIALASFVLSTICSLLLMILISWTIGFTYLTKSHKGKMRDVNLTFKFSMAALILFLIGIFCLALFALINLKIVNIY